MFYSINEFTEGKYYLLTGKGEKWSDYDGPFDTAKEAVNHMAMLCGEFTTPEMLNSAVLTHFKDNQLHLLRDDNGSPINGQQIFYNNTIYKNGEIIWESPFTPDQLHEYDDNCEHCQPAIMDRKTGKVMDKNHPIMIAVTKAWKEKTTLTERRATSRVWMGQTQNPNDFEIMHRVAGIIQQAFDEAENENECSDT